MKTTSLLMSMTAAASLLVAGCATPGGVKQLAHQLRVSQSRMADTHKQDLRNLAEYDRQRVAQFNRLLNDYLSLRMQVVGALNKALDRSKEAAIAELDYEFEREAQKITTGLFWTAFRKEADEGLAKPLRQEREFGMAKVAAAQVYVKDIEAERQALAAVRQHYHDAALFYETVETSFADMVLKVQKAQADFHNENEKLFQAIEPLALKDAAGSIVAITLPDNTDAISRRVTSLQEAYNKLDQAHGEIARCLDENNPGADFVLSVAGGLLGIDVGVLTNKESVPSTPTDSTGTKPPDLNAALSLLDGRLAEVEKQKSLAKSKVRPAIGSLIENVRPIKVIKGSNPSVLAVDTKERE